MISILFRLARTAIWCIDLWQDRRVRRQLSPVLGLCLLMGAPAFAQPRVVTLDDAETGSLMFSTTEPGEYVAAPNVRTVVEMEVTGLVSRVQVSQLFYNPTDEWLEGVYAFPLPENAAVDSLRMMIGDRYIEGTVKEREEAKEIYEAAKAEGIKTALLEQERPNLFTNSVANIGPDEDVIIQIEYQQVLRYDQGTFELRFPMVVAPRYIPGAPTAVDVPGTGWSWDTDQVPDASRITPPVSPAATDLPVEVNVHLDPGFPLSWVRSVTHDVDVEVLDDHSRRVTLADGAVLAQRDFVLEWLPEVGSAPAAGLFHEF
jgi:Ca-activated chloride channel homolog